MNISAKTQYACIAVLELSQHYAAKEPLQIRKIAEEHSIPSRFLVQILIQLRNAGLVQSIRGASGGYRLAREPKLISLAEVMNAVDGARENSVAQGHPACSPLALLHCAWAEADAAHHQVLRQISFAQLAEKVKSRSTNDYFI